MSKSSRHKKILEIIRLNSIETQNEIMDKLIECGYKIDQSTVSRDVKELRLIKIPDSNGKYKYAESNSQSARDSSKFFSLFTENVASVGRGQNIVCLKCLTGMSQAVCASFDNLKWENVVGTLAGEDTIFILFDTDTSAEAFEAQLSRLIDR